MSSAVVMIAGLLIVGVSMRLLTWFGSRRAALEVRALTGENFAIVLGGMEMTQFMGTVSKVETELGAPSIWFVPVVLLGLVLAVAANISRLVVVVISMLGIGSGILEVWVSDGAEIAGLTMVASTLLLAIMMLVRQFILRP